MDRPGRCAAICIGLVLAIAAHGGELRLKNGALIPGELAKVEAAHLVWKAELLGDIRVPKTAVQHLDSDRQLALQTSAGAASLGDCTVAVQAGHTSLACAGAAPIGAPLASLRQAPPEREDTGKVTVELTLERGAHPTEDDLSIDARRSRRVRNRRHSFEGSIDREELREETVEDEAELEYQGDLLWRDNWYFYGIAEYRRDREAAIQESVLVGAGIGKEFHPHEDVFLRLQVGPGEAELSIDEQGDEAVEVGMLRWRGQWKTPWWDAQLVHEGNYGFALEDTSVSLLEIKTGVEVPFGNSLLAELRLEYDHYGITTDGNPREDVEWVLGLGFRW